MTEISLQDRLAQARTLENAVIEAVESNRPKRASDLCRELNQRYPGFAPGWYTASQLAGRLGNRGGALQAIERALELEPDSPRWQLQKAACLMSMGETETARPILLALDKLELDTGFQCAQLGLQLSRLDLQERALHHYQRAIRLEPEEGSHYYNLATVQRFLGNFTAAETSLAQAIKLRPRDFEAYKLRSDLRTQTVERNNLASLRTALARYASEPQAQVQLNYALGKELEDIGQWTEAFQHLAAGAGARRGRMRYGVQGDLDTMAAIRRCYDETVTLADADSTRGEAAIFVFGMPRTGTTLVERVLASHSRVKSGGELNNFALAMSGAVNACLPQNMDPRKLTKEQRVELSSRLDFAALGRRYLDSVPGAVHAAPKFIDKMPLNFLYAGLIHRALPGARLVHLVRHPLDTCFAIYKTLFAEAYPFSYDLEELGHYYAGYRELMAHWEQVMPGIIYHQHYEALVADFELEAKRLVAACDLPWESGCLAFHRQQSATTTASATQVRQPVYTSSVQRWRLYRDELAPLIRVLEARGIDPEL